MSVHARLSEVNVTALRKRANETHAGRVSGKAQTHRVAPHRAENWNCPVLEPALLCFQVIPGNTNTYLESKHELEPPLWASKIRFLPYSYHRRTVCMRVELYGCYWSGKLFALANFRETCRGPVHPPDCPLTLIPARPEQICFSKSCSYNSVFARESN